MGVFDAKSPRGSRHLNEQETADYVTALLSGGKNMLSEPQLRHIAECFSCRDTILEVFAHQRSWEESATKPQREVFRAHPEMRTPRRRTFSRPLPLAASVFLSVLIAGLFYITFQNNRIPATADSSDGSRTISSTETVNPAAERERNTAEPTEAGRRAAGSSHAAAERAEFMINKNLEFMVDGQYRQAVIRVRTPLNGSSFSPGDAIPFSWDPYQQPPLTLKILDNRNREKASLTLQSNRIIFYAHLEPGLYYWKLEDQRDLLHVGKFYLR